VVHTQGTDARPVIGVDMGGTKILAAVVQGDGKILGSAKRRTRAELGPDEVIARVSETVHQAAKSADISLADIRAIGIGAPGPLDPHTGIVFHTPNMPGWNHVPLGERLSGLLGIPVFVENDVNIGTLGEYVMGAGRGTRDMVGIFVGTGVGGGIILDGQLRGGARHAAGEVGHMVVAAGGPYCGCGRQGCLEAVASRTAIERDLKAGIQNGRENLLTRIEGRQLKRMTSGVLAQAWAEGCPLTREVLSRAQWYLGLHAAAIVNLLDPEMLVYGGGLIEALGDRFLEPVRVVARQHYIYREGAPVRIVTAKLGDEAGVLGAAVVAQTRIG
jgi:glucokinase